MTAALTGVQLCDLCGDAICLTCEPDAMSRCADLVRVHCTRVCGETCPACGAERQGEQ